MYQVTKTVSQSVPPPSAPRPLCVDQSTQTEVSYPEPMDDYINKIERILLERQRTMKDLFIEILKNLYDAAGGSNFESLVNRFVVFSREYLECEEENRDDEVINENEEDADIVSHDESYSNEGMDDSEVTSENEEDADIVSNDENYNDDMNSHSEDNGDDKSEEDAQFRGLF